MTSRLPGRKDGITACRWTLNQRLSTDMMKEALGRPRAACRSGRCWKHSRAAPNLKPHAPHHHRQDPGIKRALMPCARTSAPAGRKPKSRSMCRRRMLHRIHRWWGKIARQRVKRWVRRPNWAASTPARSCASRLRRFRRKSCPMTSRPYSQLDSERVNKVEGYLSTWVMKSPHGDGIDPAGKIRLSRQAVLEG